MLGQKKAQLYVDMIVVVFVAVVLVLEASAVCGSPIVIGVDGGTESIRACCFDATNGVVVGTPYALPYPTFHPQPGWAEQDPDDWYENLGEAVRGAVSSLQESEKRQICAMCVDTTCCSVVALDRQFKPLRRSLLWMDARSAPQTREIMDKCRGNPALKRNCGGEGPLSAEWMTPKALWIRQNEPEIWRKAKTICEYQDYINYKLTGVMCASSCNAATRWHWDGEDCLEQCAGGQRPGRPLDMYRTLGIPELADKLPQNSLPMGALVGRLTAQAAAHLNLPKGLPVAQGGPDAFVGMVGLGCIHPGQLCLITGSSHLHCVVSSEPTSAPGTWGAYRGAPLPGISFAEGGQSSTGSILRWAKSLFGNDHDYKSLDEEATQIPPGCEGLVALETFQGSRTPVTDALARGSLMGLTLSHKRAHIWRALMEAVCFGTRACVEALADAGHLCNEIVIAGGATRSRVWLQMHADVTGKPVVVCENTDAPLLGCAILASVAAGIHASPDDAVRNMVRTSTRLEPNLETARVYENLYENIYKKVSLAARPVAHAIASLQSGAEVENECSVPNNVVAHRKNVTTTLKEAPIISPSLLACDWANVQSEVQQCVDAGAPQLHVDIFDGVFIDSPLALTFGPQMVHAIRRCCHPSTTLDLHMCVHRPSRYVQAMAEAGGTRFIFQWEAMGGASDSEKLEEAIGLAGTIKKSGMKCGVSINPGTAVESIYPLLETGLVDLVDVLAVEPGFGGQKFQEVALAKLRKLVAWRDRESAEVLLLVDGGVNADTACTVVDAGADILVVGTFLFRHAEGLQQGLRDLQSVVVQGRKTQE